MDINPHLNDVHKFNSSPIATPDHDSSDPKGPMFRAPARWCISAGPDVFRGPSPVGVHGLILGINKSWAWHPDCNASKLTRPKDLETGSAHEPACKQKTGRQVSLKHGRKHRHSSASSHRFRNHILILYKELKVMYQNVGVNFEWQGKGCF